MIAETFPKILAYMRAERKTAVSEAEAFGKLKKHAVNLNQTNAFKAYNEILTAN